MSIIVADLKENEYKKYDIVLRYIKLLLGTRKLTRIEKSHLPLTQYLYDEFARDTANDYGRACAAINIC
jgi:hypothetical protein